MGAAHPIITSHPAAHPSARAPDTLSTRATPAACVGISFVVTRTEIYKKLTAVIVVYKVPTIVLRVLHRYCKRSASDISLRTPAGKLQTVNIWPIE
jgi:hypothetical protein